MVELTREKYNLTEEHRGIRKPQNMSTKKLINTLNRYDSKPKGEKLLKIGLGKVAKYQMFQKMKQIMLKSCKERQ